MSTKKRTKKTKDVSNEVDDDLPIALVEKEEEEEKEEEDEDEEEEPKVGMRTKKTKTTPTLFTPLPYPTTLTHLPRYENVTVEAYAVHIASPKLIHIVCCIPPIYGENHWVRLACYLFGIDIYATYNKVDLKNILHDVIGCKMGKKLIVQIMDSKLTYLVCGRVWDETGTICLNDEFIRLSNDRIRPKLTFFERQDENEKQKKIKMADRKFNGHSFAIPHPDPENYFRELHVSIKPLDDPVIYRCPPYP